MSDISGVRSSCTLSESVTVIFLCRDNVLFLWYGEGYSDADPVEVIIAH
jgi:hypothetical protein